MAARAAKHLQRPGYAGGRPRRSAACGHDHRGVLGEIIAGVADYGPGVCGNILFIVYAALLFSYAISYAGVGEQITQFLVDLKLSKLGFLFALFVLSTVLGCLVESLGMVVVTVPLLYRCCCSTV